MKIAGGKSEKREGHYEKQRLVASHPTPHGRSVCDYLLYLIPRRRRRNSRLNSTVEQTGRHSKNQQGVRVLNTSKESEMHHGISCGRKDVPSAGKGMLS